MKEGSKEWWEQKYASTDDYLYGKAPSPFLVEHSKLLHRGETLDVAMGEGRNAVYLATQGFSVTGVDFCETAIKRAQRLAEESRAKLEAKLQDLDFFVEHGDTIIAAQYFRSEKKDNFINDSCFQR